MSKRRTKQILKLVFVVGLFYLLFKKGLVSISVKDTRHALTEWRILVPGIVALSMTLVLGVIRWKWLLDAQNIRVGWLRTLELALIGNFFNIALPGAVSGDFVKAFYIGREIAGQRAPAFGAILFDRVAGLSGLVLVSATALAYGYSGFERTPLYGAIHIFVLVAAACVVIFYGYLFLVREHHDPVLRILKNIESRFEKLSSLTRIYLGLRNYHHHRIAVTRALVVSVLIHLVVGWSLLKFAHALGDSQLPALPVYVVFPLGMLITAIPILPAGVGTGHVAFFQLFSLIGSQRGADIFTLFALTNIALGGIGGLVYLRFKSTGNPINFNNSSNKQI